MAFAVLTQLSPQRPNEIQYRFTGPFPFKPCNEGVYLVCALDNNEQGQREYLVEYDHSKLTDLELHKNWTSREYIPPDVFEEYIRGEFRAKQLGFLPEMVDTHSYKLNHRLHTISGNLQSKQTPHMVRVYRITRKLDRAICDYFIGLAHS